MEWFYIITFSLLFCSLGYLAGLYMAKTKYAAQIRQSIEREQHIKAEKYFNKMMEQVRQDKEKILQEQKEFSDYKEKADKLLIASTEAHKRIEQELSHCMVKLEQEVKRRKKAVHNTQRYKEKIKNMHTDTA